MNTANIMIFGENSNHFLCAIILVPFIGRTVQLIIQV